MSIQTQAHKSCKVEQQEQIKQYQQQQQQQHHPENETHERTSMPLIVHHTMAASSKPQFSHSTPLNVKTLTATVAMVVDDGNTNNPSSNNNNNNSNIYTNINDNSIVVGGLALHISTSGSIEGRNALQRIVLKQQKQQQQYCQTAQNHCQTCRQT